MAFSETKRQERNEYACQWRLKNLDRSRFLSRRYRAANLERARAGVRAAEQRHPARYLVRAARERAKRTRMPFDIDFTDVRVPTHCPILGTKLGPVRQKRPCDHATVPSLDRIDNRRGYVKGNVRVISLLANLMKNSATPEQLRAFAVAVLEGRFEK